MEYKVCSLIVDDESEIRRLRQRLRDDGREPQRIKTVRGEGDGLATSVEARQSCG